MDPVAGHELLRKFLLDNRLSHESAARALGVTRVSVSWWVEGQQRPRTVLRHALEKWTAGAVPASAWTHTREAALLANVVPFAPQEP